MKYILKESQLNEDANKELGAAIKKQLYVIFDVDTINWGYPYDYNDETGEEYEDTTRIEFYLGDYGEDIIFFWYDKGYWGENPDNYIGYTSKSPLVEIEEPFHSRLNNLFGNLWYKPFKEWFEENFHVPVKSVTDEISN